MPGPSRMDPDNSSSDVDSPSRYELSMERFSNFEEHIQPLRETPEASEHNSQALSQTPIDEDEIMAHLFGGPDSSQSLDDEQEAFSSPPPESTPQFVHPFSSTPTAQPSVGAGANTSEHEVVVISDSDDDVQIVEHPPQRSGSESAGDRTAIRQHLVGLADPWADLPPIPNPWEDSAEDHLSSSRTRIRSPQTIHNRSASSASSPPTNRRFSLPSISEAGLSLGSSAPWGTGSSTYTQGPSSSSLSLTLIERDMQRFRRLEEVRRRVASTQEVMDRASNAEEIRRLRQIRERACPPVGRPISQPASSTAVRPTTSAVLEGLGTRVENASRMVHLQPTATELGYAPSSESMRRMMREVTSRVARIAPPVTTSSTVERAPRSDGGNSEQRRRSLVMEGLFSDNPELLNNLRPATRRAPQYAPGTATSASASRPASPQVDRRDDQLLEPRASMSRPPPWMVSALPLTSAETRGDDRPLSPSSTSSSISSFVTATSSLGDSDSSAALSGYTVTGSHAPVVASPLRQVFVASPDSTPPTSSARLTVQRDDMNIGGIDMRDVASRVHSLTGVLTEMASSPQASVGIRDAALRLVSSGNALMRAIDDQMHMNSTSGAALSTAASANIAENDRAIAVETDVSPTLSAIDSLGVSTISDRPDRNSSLRHRLGGML
ncbi:hypothetical protein BC835DRAFT_856263 [Cytidiella melzeri]|nr:hypothetical protein BC835DRAFT_856263 [Cytidiella melzeri]